MKTINLQPTWKGLLPAMIRVLQDGEPNAKKEITNELVKMATAADALVEVVKSAEGMIETDPTNIHTEQVIEALGLHPTKTR